MRTKEILNLNSFSIYAMVLGSFNFTHHSYVDMTQQRCGYEILIGYSHLFSNLDI